MIFTSFDKKLPKYLYSYNCEIQQMRLEKLFYHSVLLITVCTIKLKGFILMVQLFAGPMKRTEFFVRLHGFFIVH